MFQDPKYAIFAVNRKTGRPIPMHVPLMLFAGYDALALGNAIAPYALACQQHGASPEQVASANERVQAFSDFAEDHPADMKVPGSGRSGSLAAQPEFPVAIDGHYTYWLSGGNVVQFVKPGEDDTILAGTTNEEVLQMLIDRITRQNGVGAHPLNEEILVHLRGALAAQQAHMTAMASKLPPGVVERFGILMHPCDSSNLAAHGYDASTQVLQLEFKSKSADGATRIYRYKDVPKTAYDGLLEAKSKGSYASRHIVGLFEGEPMPEDTQPA